jgi:hypothetical protein
MCHKSVVRLLDMKILNANTQAFHETELNGKLQSDLQVSGTASVLKYKQNKVRVEIERTNS